MYLITYQWTRDRFPDEQHFSMTVAKCPIEWLIKAQEFEREAYILINAQPITEEQAKQIDGNLKGM